MTAEEQEMHQLYKKACYSKECYFNNGINFSSSTINATNVY
jgi:hypothetical protein